MKEAAGPLLRRWQHEGTDGFIFYCPGCKAGHTIRTKTDPNRGWTFNGNLEKPTFTPSVKLSYPACDGLPEEVVCHSFVTDGQIQFLSDCAHELANKTVPLPPFPENYG